MADFLYKDEGYAILGACFEVYNTLLPGLSEDIYKLALGVEFDRRGIPYEREKELKVYYKGVLLPKKYFADLVCYGHIIVEAKAVSGLIDDHRGQLLNYMRITNTKIGYLVNFGAKEKLQWQRMTLAGSIAEQSFRNPQLAEHQEESICGNLRQSVVSGRGAEPQINADFRRCGSGDPASDRVYCSNLKNICGNLRQSVVSPSNGGSHG